MSRSESRRSRLFKFLRCCFFCNVLLFFAVVGFFFYVRSQRSRLVELSEKLFAHNLALSVELSSSRDFITNRVYRSSYEFASNVWLAASAYVVSNSVVSSSVSLNSSSSSAAAGLPSDIPSLSFHSFFSVNDVPYVYLGSRVYKVGDVVLGYPIEDICPDFVKYRGSFIKVLSNEK